MRIRNNINPSWSYLDNDSSNNFGRIWIAWDPRLLQVNLLRSSPQAIFLEVVFSPMINFVATFVYVDNYYMTRNSLWASIIAFASINTRPRVLLGDFNSLLYPSDKLGGSPVMPIHYQDFSRCVQLSQIFDLQFSGCFYTWTNCQLDGAVIRSKLDRGMVNLQWIQQFQLSKADFLLPGISDHSPCVVFIFEQRKHGPPPFRFYNFLSEEKDFMNVVRGAWNITVRGNPMIVFVIKLKNVKHAIIHWKKARFKNMSEQVLQDKDKMDSAQLLLQTHPLDFNLSRRERKYVVEYVKIDKYEEFVAKQQSRIKWLDLGDSNTSFFHNSLKVRRSKNNILSLYNSENVKLEEDQDIAKEYIAYYSDLFGSDLNEEDNSTSLSRLRIDACIQQDDVEDLIKPVTREEVVVALHYIGSSKVGP
ncbi:uncharacterized protein LOC113359761 [Papaver somniferum]|uniref:uncharacterized protein LOC113359761 n=1 Tax=Papaver somniferum TaxID=3469 RepID=UPI000E6FD9D0|nr:uncharacterized protein LOC113359761 [Papaver somniferum]